MRLNAEINTICSVVVTSPKLTLIYDKTIQYLDCVVVLLTKALKRCQTILSKRFIPL